MITGEIKSKIDRIWDSFWTGGVSNPLEVMEQITYLLFIRRLDDLQTLEENKANRTKKPIERRTFPEGNDPKKRPYEDLRWSRFKHFEPKEMFEVMAEHVFPFLRTLGGDDSTYAHHMKDARFTIPTPALLAKVVDMIDGVPMEDRDTKGDLYEYMLGKIATAGQNGQFRTPRHEIQFMVELLKPLPTDVMCDPASGTCGFPVEEQKLDGIVSMPGGVFKPFAGVSTAILLFTKTNSGGTGHVWFYDMQADGKSLDDKRTDLLPPEKQGPKPTVKLAKDEHAKNNLPDILSRFSLREKSERKNPRTAQSFCVPKSDIVEQGYDLSINRYKEVVHEEVDHRPPQEILDELESIEKEITNGMKELRRMLK
ncbi:N-6 DNA methylase [Pirellulaceae bacterium SH449]